MAGETSEPVAVETAADLARLLRRLRRREARQRGAPELTYRELAAKTGWSRTAIGEYFAGTTLPPTDRFDVLVHLLGATRAEQGALATARDRVEERRRAASAGAAVTGAPPPAPPPAPPVTPPATLPADVPAFTGRRAELRELDRLTTDQRVPLVISAVSGTAGVGKTALALHWAHRVRDRFPDGQLYVDLRGYDPRQPMPAGEALAGFLRALGISGAEIPLDEAEAAARYRTAIAGRRILIVLDNAASVEQVRPLLPGTASCAVLVTSRDSLAGLVARHGAHRLALDLLPPDDAMALLRGLLGARVDAEPEAAATLANQCAYLPLALRVAAERAIARPDVRLAELVAELADRGRRLRLLDAGGDPRSAVATVFSWSHDHLRPEAARAFRLIGRHPGTTVDAYAVAALTGASAEAAGQLLDELARVHLAQPSGAGRYGMHDLLRAYAAGLPGTPDGDRAARERLLDYYLSTASAAMNVLHPAKRHFRPDVPAPATPAPHFDTPAAALAWLDSERATLVAVAGHAADHGYERHVIDLAPTLWQYLAGGYYAEAVAIHSRVLEAAARVGDRRAQARALTDLGTAYGQLGNYDRAVPYFERGLAISRDAGDLAGEARALTNLGLVRDYQGRYGDAAGYYQRALGLFRRAGDRSGEASVRGDLAVIYEAQGHYRQAADHYQQVLEAFRELDDRDGQARALHGLGMIYMRLGQPEQAADHLQRALAHFVGSGVPWAQAWLRCGLGTLHMHRNQPEQAAEHHEQALNIFRRIGDRSGEAEALDGLGLAYQRLGRDAVELHRRALAIVRETGERAGEAKVLNSLGEALRRTGPPEQAQLHHAEALSVAVEIGNRYERARAHYGIGHAHRAAGDSAEARRHWLEAMAGYRDLGVPEADGVATDLAALSSREESTPPPG